MPVANLPAMTAFELRFHVPAECSRSVERELAQRHGVVEQAMPLLSSADAPHGRAAGTFTRLLGDLHLGASRVAVSLERVRPLDGAHAPDACELALALAAGDPADVITLGIDWSGRHGLWLCRPRARAAHGPVGDGAGDEAVKAHAPDIDATLTGPRLLRRVVQAALDQVLPNAGAVAAGSSQQEAVHQLRVGLRRLRTALRELAMLDESLDAAPLEATLAEAFARLGDFRDNETVMRAVQPLLDEARAPKRRWDGAPAQAQDPAAAVRHRPFQEALLDLLRFAASEPAPGPGLAPAEAIACVQRRLSRLHRRVSRDGRRFESLDTAQQHRVRKRLKRLRYLAEFVAPLWPERRVRRYLGRLEPAQDALGRHNDLAVAHEHFRRDAEHDPRSHFAAGLLLGRRRFTAREAREALDDVASAKTFWKRAPD